MGERHWDALPELEKVTSTDSREASPAGRKQAVENVDLELLKSDEAVPASPSSCGHSFPASSMLRTPAGPGLQAFREEATT